LDPKISGKTCRAFLIDAPYIQTTMTEVMILDTELHFDGETDSLYSHGLDLEEDVDTLAGTHGSSGQYPEVQHGETQIPMWPRKQICSRVVNSAQTDWSVGAQCKRRIGSPAIFRSVCSP
jgi:hypothetical protein